MGKFVNSFQLKLDTVLKAGTAIKRSNHASLSKMAGEWHKFMQGQEVDTGIVSGLVYESWQRSRDCGVDPYFQSDELLTKEQVHKQVKDNESLIRKFGDIILDIQKLARKNGLTVQLFNTEAKNIQLIALANYYNRDVVNVFAVTTDATERSLGTNAVCLALRENRPIEILGAEHFNHNLHNTFCCAAPVHDSNGEIIGAVNIASYNYRQSSDNLILATFLAKLFDNISLILDTMDELESYNFAINETIEYFPQGMLYVDGKDEIKYYNKKLIEILGANPTTINEQISKFLVLLKDYGHNDSIENEIIEIEKGGLRKFLTVTVKDFIQPHRSHKERIIIIAEQARTTDLQSNTAYYTFNDIVGQNEKLIVAKNLAQKVAKANCSILIFGDNGTGKEVFAQAIHNASTRREKPFVAINCGAIPNELVESELFGYETGAFTGAVKGGKKGKLEMASGGTLFLDEIESMPLNMQIKLLRTLSTKQVCRVGGNKEIPVDVRIISATKKNLLEEADNGRFRDDLYYRISTISITLPTLCERQDDIYLLADHFVKKYSRELNLPPIKIDPAFYEALAQYAWRGNVRELSNVIERTLLLIEDEQELKLSHLPEKIIKAYNYKNIKSKLSVINTQKNSSDNLLKLSEEIIIELLLKEENGIICKVAERMGISRQTLYNKIGQNEKLKHKLQKSSS